MINITGIAKIGVKETKEERPTLINKFIKQRVKETRIYFVRAI